MVRVSAYSGVCNVATERSLVEVAGQKSTISRFEVVMRRQGYVPEIRPRWGDSSK